MTSVNPSGLSSNNEDVFKKETVTFCARYGIVKMVTFCARYGTVKMVTFFARYGTVNLWTPTTTKTNSPWLTKK